MTVDPRDCAATSNLLQAYVDGELSGSEHQGVAHHIEDCAKCTAGVQQQLQVRASLRAIRPETAPLRLRSHLLSTLDRVDSQTVQETNVPLPSDPARMAGARAIAFVRAFGRGVTFMVPASAAAIGLFFLARGAGPIQTASNADAVTQTELNDAPLPAIDGPHGGFPTQRHHSPGIDLVSNAENANHARLEYQNALGERLIDHQRLASIHHPPRGRSQRYKKRLYYVGTDDQGSTQIEFVIAGVHHRVVMHRSQRLHSSKQQVLLEMAHSLRSSHRAP